MDQRNKFLEDQFNRKANSFQSYALSANDLYLCGKTLYEKFSNDLVSLEKGISPEKLPYLRTFFICMMLFGLTIENLLKSLIIKNGINYQSGTINRSIRTHNLNMLFDDCKLIKSNDEKEILDVLSEFIIWAGRYPVPIKFQDMGNLWSSGKHLFVPEKLYQRLLCEVEK